MGKKILDSKALYVVLSVIIAVALWFYVASLDDETYTFPGINVPVQFVGQEVLESRNLMIVGDPPTVNLRISTTASTYAKLDRADISVTVDVSSISAAQEYSLGYTVTFPSDLANSIQVVSQTPTNVTFTVARYIESEIEIRGVFEGSVAEGYLPGDTEDFLFSPSTITVSGQEELVNQISYALVTVTGEDLTETVSGEYTYQFISNSGEVLDLDVECSTETVYVTFPVWATAEVPLTMNFVYGGGATEDNVRYEMDYDSIIISGDKDDVAAVTEVVLETVDLSAVEDGETLTLRIPLANELNNLSGYSEVNVTIHIDGVETKSVETTNISYIYAPDGWNVELITKAITVTVRGPRDELETISGENIRVVVDLSDVSPAAGQYTLTARVYLNSVGTEAGVFGTDYRVVVALSR